MTKRTEKQIKEPSLDELLIKPKAKKQKEGISNRLEEILADLKMTQQELADLTELYPSHISEIVKGVRKGVTLPTAIKIAKALNMKVEDIFFTPTP